MKKITFLFVVMLLATISNTFGQEVAKTSVFGIVTDNQGSPLPGATILEKGTSNGALTDFNGKFSLEVTSKTATVTISYIGFATKEVSFDGSKSLGTIMLDSDSFGLEEVMIVASVAVDRKTPVAVSTIKADEIALKLGTQEFPEVLKSTPGVYATKQGGGFGDGDITLRGFDSQNVAVMINGVPVNDMETGRVFWSNWAGLSDVTSSMQVQRGLGASKVAVPSIGGTINILTSTTDVEKGGNIIMTNGNDGFQKYGFKYSTGLMDNGFAATILGSKTFGNGYVDGTPFSGISYFVNVSKEINENHKLAFTAFGAKQRHGQRRTNSAINDYRASERGIKYNPDWGYKNGQLTSIRENFYHKPQVSLNHYWDISDRTDLSTAVYYSTGTGGGISNGGDQRGKLNNSIDNENYRIGEFGPIDIDRVVEENIANGANGSDAILRASRNDHTWYGLLSTLKTDLTDELTLLGGLDLRHYRGKHFQELTDLLGGQFYEDDSNINDSNIQKQVGDKIGFNNDGIVDWIGFFGQLEYSKDKLDAFVALNASNTGYRRVDYFQKLDSDPAQETDTVNFIGYGAKAGANYNFDEYQNIFVNGGYFERAPYFRTIWPNFDNDQQNSDAENQKILSLELGYGLRTEKFAANINIYYTAWNDRTEFVSFDQEIQGSPTGETQELFANILGVNAIHQGVEFDFEYRPFDFLTFTGMVSVGDWKWQDDIAGVEIRDQNDQTNVLETVNIFIKDLPVGGTAQTTSALGLSYNMTPKTTFSVDYNYYDRLFSSYNPSNRNDSDGLDPWRIPSYSLFDTSLRHKFKIGDFDASITARMNNVFNVEYISNAIDANVNDRIEGDIQSAGVYFGAGRTFSIGAKIDF